MTFNNRLPPFIYWLLLFVSVFLFIYSGFLYNRCYAADINLLMDYEDFVDFKNDPLELVRSLWEDGYKPEKGTDDYKLYERILELKDMNCKYFSSYLSNNKKEHYMFFTKWPLAITDSGTVRYSPDAEILDNQYHYAPCITFVFDDATKSYKTNSKITNIEFWLLDYRNDTLELQYSNYYVYTMEGELVYKAYPHWVHGIYFWLVPKSILECISFKDVLSVLVLGLGISGVFFIGWFGIRKLIKMVIVSIRKGNIKI